MPELLLFTKKRKKDEYMKPKITTIIVLMVFIFSVSLHAHGVKGKVGKGEIVVGSGK